MDKKRKTSKKNKSALNFKNGDLVKCYESCLVPELLGDVGVIYNAKNGGCLIHSANMEAFHKGTWITTRWTIGNNHIGGSTKWKKIN